MFIARKKVDISLSFRDALKSVYGIGAARLYNLWKRLNYRRNVKLKEMSYAKRIGLSRFTDRYITDKLLKKKERHILSQHLQCGTYKGIRFRQGMPANGQRTHSNSSTARRKLQLAKFNLK